MGAGREGVETRRFWRVDSGRTIRYPLDEDYVEAFDDLFSRVVKSQLRASGPVGVMMSGGLDSSSVAAVAAPLLEEEGKDLAAFTEVPRPGFDGPLVRGRYADETPYVQAIARMHGNLRSHLVRTDGRMYLEDLDSFFAAAEVPFRNATGVEICGSCVRRFGRKKGVWWFPETHEAICADLIFRCTLLPSTVMMQTRIAKAHRFREDAAFEDYEYWTRLALLHRMGNVPRILVKYRQHSAQSHVMESEAIGKDLVTYRLPYLRKLFPDASTDDFGAIARIADGRPIDNFRDLERAGTWLVRLAQTPDRFLRQRMADRWTAACRRSAHLGLGCYRLYRCMAPRFEIPEDRKTRVVLLLACALRLKADSKVYKVFGGLKRTWTIRRQSFRKNNR